MKWICCQIGAREHYAVARAIHRLGLLDILLTDVWVPPGNLFNGFGLGLHNRYHPELAKANVAAENFRSIFFELRARSIGLADWPRMISRNRWFQEMVQGKLSATRPDDASRVLFAYSYAAREIFEFARAQGWRTVLGQIDAGPPDERIVAGVYAACPAERSRWTPAPAQYWYDWRQECALADRIVVNSAWSRAALEEEGVPAAKIRVVPLAYEAPAEAGSFHREYPDAFDAVRPLRLLFLGNIGLRKGVGAIFDAMRLLRGEAVEFRFVGPLSVTLPSDIRDLRNVHWVGAVPQADTGRYYRDADMFLFPTVSDGFGLTQLEAQAWKLPVIATTSCGEVVEDGKNGILLAQATGACLTAAIRRCLADPGQLARFAENSVPANRFGLDRIGRQLLQVFD
jgi:glycosyltransferase involved in cell wall biosynthesis